MARAKAERGKGGAAEAWTPCRSGWSLDGSRSDRAAPLGGPLSGGSPGALSIPAFAARSAASHGANDHVVSV
eukprot:8026182-Prorocentrum_lima.AAC.1